MRRSIALSCLYAEYEVTGLFSGDQPPVSGSEGRRAAVSEVSEEDEGSRRKRDTKIRVVGNHKTFQFAPVFMSKILHVRARVSHIFLYVCVDMVTSTPRVPFSANSCVDRQAVAGVHGDALADGAGARRAPAGRRSSRPARKSR